MEGLREALEVATTKAEQEQAAARQGFFGDKQVNVGNQERRMCGALGSYLVVQGARRSRTVTGILGLVLGGLLVRRAVSGHCEFYQKFGTGSV